MRTTTPICLAACLTALPVVTALANNANHQSHYAGQEQRDIKSLSAEDIAELEAGAGWGLAKAAELNGVPGPRHLLEMRDDISLSDGQVAAIEQLYSEMNASAVELGKSLIEQERQLELRFQNDIPSESELESLLAEIGKTRSALRFVHLSAHLKTPGILSREQIDHYNRLRGYASADPCQNIPEGHDPEMWKKHNDCN